MFNSKMESIHILLYRKRSSLIELQRRVGTENSMQLRPRDVNTNIVLTRPHSVFFLLTTPRLGAPKADASNGAPLTLGGPPHPPSRVNGS